LSDFSVLSADEIVNVLKRSFLPTILVEGTTDAFIYRKLKELCSHDSQLTILFCGGRIKLLEVYERRSEYPKADVCFVADLDSFKFDGVPPKYSDVVFTAGYCIENDIYYESGVESLIEQTKQAEFRALREVIGTWFAHELQAHRQRLLSGNKSTISVNRHINEVSPIGTAGLCPSFKLKCSYVEPCETIVNEIFDSYDLNVRGKQLFQMTARYLSGKDSFSQFSHKNLIEVALKTMLSGSMKSLSNRIDATFKNNGRK